VKFHEMCQAHMPRLCQPAHFEFVLILLGVTSSGPAPFSGRHRSPAAPRFPGTRAVLAKPGAILPMVSARRANPTEIGFIVLRRIVKRLLLLLTPRYNVRGRQ